MKKLFILFLIAAMLASPVLLSGCAAVGAAAAAAEEQPVAVAVLICNSANRAAPDFSSPKLQEAVKKAVGTYGYICVISVDGDPAIVLKGSCDIDPRYKEADPQKLAQEASARTIQLMSQIQSVRADDPEVDLLSAMHLAVRTLADAPAGSRKCILIIDSGLSTIGLVDFRNNLLNGEADAIAAALDEMEAIPDLTGVEVAWQGIGDVAQPQAPLSPRQVNQLKAIWTAIIRQGGGTLSWIETPPASSETDDALPTVSTVSLAMEVPLAFEPKAMEEPAFAFDEPVFLRESQVRFVGDSDAFVDAEAAAETVKPIAELMQKNTDLQLLLVGTTAGDATSDYALALSSGRADAVKKLLVSLGVDGARIQTIGMGSSDPWHIANAGLQGELASQNRKVVLINAESDVAQAILKGGVQ